jgi:hypothetical protein
MILASPSSLPCALYAPLIVPDKIRNADERLYGETGVCPSAVFLGSDSTIEPWDGRVGSVIASPNDVRDRLRFFARDLRRSEANCIVCETELGQKCQCSNTLELMAKGVTCPWRFCG